MFISRGLFSSIIVVISLVPELAEAIDEKTDLCITLHDDSPVPEIINCIKQVKRKLDVVGNGQGSLDVRLERIEKKKVVLKKDAELFLTTQCSVVVATSSVTVSSYEQGSIARCGDKSVLVGGACAVDAGFGATSSSILWDETDPQNLKPIGYRCIPSAATHHHKTRSGPNPLVHRHKENDEKPKENETLHYLEKDPDEVTAHAICCLRGN